MLKYTDKYIQGEMKIYTDCIMNSVTGMMAIWNTGNKALIAKMHNINDKCINDIERAIYGATIKEIKYQYLQEKKDSIK